MTGGTALKKHLLVEMLQLLKLRKVKVVNVTLKPHFTKNDELFGVLNARLACRIYLLGKGMAEAFVAMIKQEYDTISCHNTTLNPSYRFYLTSPKKGRMIEMLWYRHIPHLLYHAGLFVKFINCEVSADAWLEPFYDGLSWNKRLQVIHETAGSRCIRAFGKVCNFNFPELRSDGWFNKWNEEMSTALFLCYIQRLSISLKRIPDDASIFEPLRRHFVKHYKLLYHPEKDEGWFVDYDILEHMPEPSAIESFHCGLPIYDMIAKQMIDRYGYINKFHLNYVMLWTPRSGTPLSNIYRLLTSAFEEYTPLIKNYPGEDIKIKLVMWYHHPIVVKHAAVDAKKLVKTLTRELPKYTVTYRRNRVDIVNSVIKCRFDHEFSPNKRICVTLNVVPTVTQDA